MDGQDSQYSGDSQKWSREGQCDRQEQEVEEDDQVGRVQPPAEGGGGGGACPGRQVHPTWYSTTEAPSLESRKSDLVHPATYAT